MADSRPLYIRIKEGLINRISSGEWNPGDVLPSEQSLAAEYSVAQGTMRKAIDLLVSDNLLLRLHGKGTYVTTHDWRSKQWRIFRLYDDAGSHHRPAARLVSYKVGNATSLEAKKLALEINARVIRATRVRVYQDEPVVLEKLVLPRKFFGELGKEDLDAPAHSHLYPLFAERCGVIIATANEMLRAVSAGPEEVRHLNVLPGHPLLAIDRVAIDVKDQPVEWRISICNTEKHYYKNKD